MRKLESLDGYFQGAVSLEHLPAGVRPWRIPYVDIDLFPPDGLGGRAIFPAGVRLSLASDTTAVEVGVAPRDAEMQLDLVVNDELRETAVAQPEEERVRFAGLPSGMKSIDIYLSQKMPVIISGLWVEAGAGCAPAPVTKPRWVTYGSSITQCGAAASPAQTWPALVARRAGWHLTCLGYGGNCHLEPMVGRLIRDLPADYISMCLGINVQGSASLGPRTFRAAVIGLVKLVREKHERIPIAVMSPIISPPRETKPNVVGLTLEKMRDEIAAAVAALQSRGDDRLIYVDGLELFDASLVDHLPDQLHPDAEGYRIMGEHFLERVAPRLRALSQGSEQS